MVVIRRRIIMLVAVEAAVIQAHSELSQLLPEQAILSSSVGLVVRLVRLGKVRMEVAGVVLRQQVMQVVLVVAVLAHISAPLTHLNLVPLAGQTEATAAILISTEAQDKGLQQESLGKQAQPCILAAVAVVLTRVILVRTALVVLAAAVTEITLVVDITDIREPPTPAAVAVDAPTAAPPARAAAASLSSVKPGPRQR